jgi:HEAT repeat protein
MPRRQPDLFDTAGFRPNCTVPAEPERARPPPTTLDDDALVAAITRASLADCHDLAAEGGRRRLTSAVPALEALCRRFKGFGVEHAIPEQIAALRGLAAIPGRDSAQAVGRIIVDHVVQGPGLRTAAAVAAEIGANLPSVVVASLLRHPDPGIRASACRCARPGPAAITLMTELLGDLNTFVATAAACSLGRMGKVEGRPALALLLRHAPSVEVIDAASTVADEECLVLLGRVARTRPDLADAVIAALESIDEPRAAQIAAAARRGRQ